MTQSDSRILFDAVAWTARLWPVLLVGLLLLLRHRQLRYRLAFFVLGCLVCFGVASLVAQVAATWRVTSAAASPLEQLVDVLTQGLVVVIVASVLVSFPLLLWLVRLLSARKEHG